MAGEIFIAKEATSQDIKTIVDANGNALSSLSTNLATANANINTVNSNVNALANSVKKPNGKGYKFFTHAIVTSSLTQVLSISGSGFLKSAFSVNVAYSSNYYSQITVTVDGTVILNINVATLAASYAQGIVDKRDFYSTEYVALPLCNGYNIKAAYLVGSLDRVGTVPLLFPSSTEQSLDNAGALLIIPELIRFSSSLVIKVKKQHADIRTVVEYYLD